jgi:hypothetical protein
MGIPLGESPEERESALDEDIGADRWDPIWDLNIHSCSAISTTTADSQITITIRPLYPPFRLVFQDRIASTQNDQHSLISSAKGLFRAIVPFAAHVVAFGVYSDTLDDGIEGTCVKRLIVVRGYRR